MAEQEIIRETKEEKKQDARYPKRKIEFEPDPDKHCQHRFLFPESPTKSKIVECFEPADYRVLLYSLKKYLEGDGSNTAHWKHETTEEYYCTKHFDEVYRYAPPPTPLLTFRKIERPRQPKE